MTHKYQGKNLPTPHTMACTAAPGPCICNNAPAGEHDPRCYTRDGSGLCICADLTGDAALASGEPRPAEHSEKCMELPENECICPARNIVLTNAAQLGSILLTPEGAGRGSIAAADHTVITDPEGELVAAFDEDGTLTGGKLFHNIGVYKSIVVSARSESRIYRDSIAKLRDIHAKDRRSSRNTIFILGAALIINVGISIARGIWGF